MLFFLRPKNQQTAQQLQGSAAAAWRRSNLTLSLFLPLLLALHANPARSMECAELPPSTVIVKRLETPISLNLEYSYKTLKALGEDYTRNNLEVLGLTRGTATAKFDIKSQISRTPKNDWECSSITVTLEYGFSPITVYVGREFPQGSCAHDEIYRHELMHVNAYTEHAKNIEQEITDILKRRFERDTPWRNAAGHSQLKLQAEINERWIPYLKRTLNKVKVAQRGIDSPEEYARVAASCDGAIKRQMHGTMTK
jgi:hypothetical protein